MALLTSVHSVMTVAIMAENTELTNAGRGRASPIATPVAHSPEVTGQFVAPYTSMFSNRAKVSGVSKGDPSILKWFQVPALDGCM